MLNQIARREYEFAKITDFFIFAEKSFISGKFASGDFVKFKRLAKWCVWPSDEFGQVISSAKWRAEKK